MKDRESDGERQTVPKSDDEYEIALRGTMTRDEDEQRRREHG